jgi:hypothetical protein
MAYSIVDAMIYARPDEWTYTNAPDFDLFAKLSDQVSDRLYAQLFEIYMRFGDQTQALIEWAKEHGLNYMNNTVYAENVNYWKSSQKHAETWIDDAIKLIKRIGGTIDSQATITDHATGSVAFALAFTINGEHYRIAWPSLPSKTGDNKAARVQAATLLYHDVKHKVVIAKVKGVRAAFLEYYVLPSGESVGESVEQFAAGFLLPSGEMK